MSLAVSEMDPLGNALVRDEGQKVAQIDGIHKLQNQRRCQFETEFFSNSADAQGNDGDTAVAALLRA